jgi:CubicO group peptidase (beta-lactamase class C family)
MPDTSFWVPPDKASRLTMAYNYDEKGDLTLYDGNGPDGLFSKKPTYLSGGAGLISSTRDFYRFAAMLLNGGRLGDVVLLSRKTVELMSLDHLPPVVTDVAKSRCLSSLGDIGWGGMLGTQAWMNPEEQMVVMIMIQVRAEVPTGIMDIYKRMVYQALVAG